MTIVYEADLTWLDDRFVRGVQVAVGDDGRIGEVGEGLTSSPVVLADRAMAPGFVNAHSHAFQRGLRGLGERFPDDAGSFWTWREAMYELVETLDANMMFTWSSRAFREMKAAGITTVGEFHYVHHDATGGGFALDDAVLAAARDVGIRIRLLQSYYRTGGIDAPVVGGQRRFATPTLESYWAHFDRLAKRLDSATQSLGVVAHSIRAVPLEDLIALHEESQRRGRVFHMHVEEQPAEIEACLDRYGVTPMRLLNDNLSIDPRFTAVHCTHTADADLEEFLDAGAQVCICPLTEANLGDGIAHVAGMRRRGGSVCIGTDSNSRLSFTEEVRWLEYVQRLARQERGSLRNGDGDLAAPLMDIATQRGARALGLPTGRIRAGQCADLQLLDLTCPSLGGWRPETLVTAFLLGTGNEAIVDVCVGGAWMHGTA